MLRERFDWVQTVDRVRIANRLSEQRPAHLPPLNVLIEVNISGEATKSGVAVKEVTELGKAIASLPRLRLRGLMAIPAPGAAGDFVKMTQLYEKLRAQFGFDTLSMGMSDDLDRRSPKARPWCASAPRSSACASTRGESRHEDRLSSAAATWRAR